MKTTLCTLFNVNYIDKGLVLYDSLEQVSKDFILYVLAMDDRCFEILSDINKPFLRPIKLRDFENAELIKAKSNRPFGEYCWTCSSALIKYVLETYKPEDCTYIDADMYFYSDPQVLIDEMYASKASVLVVGHRFLKPLEKSMIHNSGRYCVEFNTFKNDDRGKRLLNIWYNQCLECCTHLKGVYCGDQKYLDKWCEDYDFVHETTNLGAGVAPWNISQYKLLSNDDEIIVRCRRKTFKMVFYHYEGITYITDKIINTNSYNYWGVDDKLVNTLYPNYIKQLDKKKRFLKERYGFDYIMKSHPADCYTSKQSIIDRFKNLYNRLKSSEGLNCIIFDRIPSELFKSRRIYTLK